MKTNITQIVKRSFIIAYKRPMVSAFVNLAWFFLILFIFPIGPVTLGVYHFANELQKPGSTHFSDFTEGVKEYWLDGLLVSLAQLTILVVLAADWFFLLQSRFVAKLDVIYQTALYFFGIYLTIFLLLIFLYIYPLVVNTDRGLLFVYSRAFFIPLKFPILSVSLGLANLLVFLISVLFPPLFMLYFAVLSALLGDNALSYLRS